MKDYKASKVKINKEEIIIHEINNTDAPYSRLYQTDLTRELDRVFGLEGKPVGPESEIAKKLVESSEKALKLEVQNFLEYVVRFVVGVCNFYGFPEEELRKYTRYLNNSLEFMNGYYAKRRKIRGEKVIFVDNLK